MILVIAAEVDVHAMDLAIAWADQPAKRVTSRDLSSAGWSMTGGGEPSTFVVEGERHGSEEVDGILVRLPAVQPSQLTTSRRTIAITRQQR